jgi:hypothetical protein
MLRHYRALGVDESVVHVHAETCESEERYAIERTVKHEGGVIGTVSVVPWQVSLNTMLYSRAKTRYPNDWFVVADQDEFQVYPDGLHDAIAYCDQHGYEFIEGAFVDRTTADGRLAAVHDNEPLWTQFPFGSMVSALRKLTQITLSFQRIRDLLCACRATSRSKRRSSRSLW